MTIVSKYDIGDIVFMVKTTSSRDGEFNIVKVCVDKIQIIKTDELNITYEVRELANSPYYYTVNEIYLFKNEKDLISVFTANSRMFLNKNKTYKVSDIKICEDKQIELDVMEPEDLPF
jgi:hypothetical protein